MHARRHVARQCMCTRQQGLLAETHCHRCPAGSRSPERPPPHSLCSLCHSQAPRALSRCSQTHDNSISATGKANHTEHKCKWQGKPQRAPTHTSMGTALSCRRAGSSAPAVAPLRVDQHGRAVAHKGALRQCCGVQPWESVRLGWLADHAQHLAWGGLRSAACRASSY
jgi:hypothetical protein